MQLCEFENQMNEQAGWTFPAEYYETIIEPVYMATNEGKEDFAKYCIKHDLNGLELLHKNLRMVDHLSGLGMNIDQIHAVVRMLSERDTQIASLRESNLACQVALRNIRTLAGDVGIGA